MVFCFLKPASRAYALVGAVVYLCIIAEGVACTYNFNVFACLNTAEE